MNDLRLNFELPAGIEPLEEIERAIAAFAKSNAYVVIGAALNARIKALAEEAAGHPCGVDELPDHNHAMGQLSVFLKLMDPGLGLTDAVRREIQKKLGRTVQS